MSELYDGPDGCDFDSCCPNWPALKAENAELREQRMSLVRSTVILAEENTQLRAVADAARSVSKEYPEIARRHGLGQALAALDAPQEPTPTYYECPSCGCPSGDHTAGCSNE